MDKIFASMDRDKDAKLTYDEFVEGSKHDPTIVKVCDFSGPPFFFVSLFTSCTGSLALRRTCISANATGLSVGPK